MPPRWFSVLPAGSGVNPMLRLSRYSSGRYNTSSHVSAVSFFPKFSRSSCSISL